MIKTTTKHTDTGCISVAFDGVEEGTTDGTHGKSATTIIHNPPWAESVHTHLINYHVHTDLINYLAKHFVAVVLVLLNY